MGHLRRARYVQHQRNAGWPNGREPHGHEVSVVVGGRESRPRGEGRQAGRHLKGQRVRDAQRPEPSGCRLSGELIDTETVTISSEGGGWKRALPGMPSSQGTQVVFTNELTALVPRLLPGSISRFANSIMSRTKP